MAVDAREFRQALSQFATGVTVVTTRHGETVHGLTVNAFCSLSLEPPLIVACLDKRTRSHDLIIESGVFAVNILSAEQEHVSDRFAGRHGPEFEEDRFAGIAYGFGILGAPLIAGCLAQLECRLAATHEGGDHTIFVGEVAETGVWEGEPLGYWNGRYRVIG
jgi:flavin reductase (DIM6/NTAB) family NADH-FMN oxidoreductase RutF